MVNIPQNTSVVHLEKSQFDAGIEALTRAFDQDPFFRYFCADREAKRQNCLRLVAQLTLRYCEPYLHIYTTLDSLKGIAAWLPPGEYPVNYWRLLQLGFYALPFQVQFSRLGQFVSLFNTLENLHKQDVPEPHWYLWILGVAPDYQNQGIGSALLQPVLKQADIERVPCYLETSTESGVRFYQRQGFEVIRTGRIAANVPPYWTLKRSPHWH
jgi:GNAT superfamily N-acetyltransferase